MGKPSPPSTLRMGCTGCAGRHACSRAVGDCGRRQRGGRPLSARGSPLILVTPVPTGRASQQGHGDGRPLSRDAVASSPLEEHLAMSPTASRTASSPGSGTWIEACRRRSLLRGNGDRRAHRPYDSQQVGRPRGRRGMAGEWQHASFLLPLRPEALGPTPRRGRQRNKQSARCITD
jgi:hypothetical protein